MSRRKPVRRVTVPIAQLHAIVERTRTEPLPADAHATLKAAVDTLARLTEELETTTTTLERVRRLIFGPRTETTARILGPDTPAGTPTDTPADRPAETPTDSATETATDHSPRKRRPGHGRNGIEQYPRAPRVTVTHDTRQHGDPCPAPGGTGRVYVQRVNGGENPRKSGEVLREVQRCQAHG